jgi:hypothetical protein
MTDATVAFLDYLRKMPVELDPTLRGNACAW